MCVRSKGFNQCWQIQNVSCLYKYGLDRNALCFIKYCLHSFCIHRFERTKHMITNLNLEYFHWIQRCSCQAMYTIDSTNLYKLGSAIDTKSYWSDPSDFPNRKRTTENLKFLLEYTDQNLKLNGSAHTKKELGVYSRFFPSFTIKKSGETLLLNSIAVSLNSIADALTELAVVPVYAPKNRTSFPLGRYTIAPRSPWLGTPAPKRL